MFFLVQFLAFVKKKANSAIEQQKQYNHRKRNRFLVSKVEFCFQTCFKKISLFQFSQIGFILSKKSHSKIDLEIQRVLGVSVSLWSWKVASTLFQISVGYVHWWLPLCKCWFLGLLTAFPTTLLKKIQKTCSYKTIIVYNFDIWLHM